MSIKQVWTVPASAEAILRDPNFLRGVAEVRAGKPFNPDIGVESAIGADAGDRLINGQWGYERGRLFADCTDIPVFLDDGSTLNPVALAVLRLAFDRAEIL
jgi:hypothetical protein